MHNMGHSCCLSSGDSFDFHFVSAVAVNSEQRVNVKQPVEEKSKLFNNV